MEGNGGDPLLLCLCSQCEGGRPPCLTLGLASVNCKSQPCNVGVGVILGDPAGGQEAVWDLRLSRVTVWVQCPQEPPASPPVVTTL